MLVPDCPISLMGKDLLTKLGATLFLKGGNSSDQKGMAAAAAAAAKSLQS